MPFGRFLMSLGGSLTLLGIVLMILALGWGASVVARQLAQRGRP